MSFVPKDYEVNSGNNDFFKLKAGDNKFRIVSDAVIGKVGWKDNKPFRRGGDFAQILEKEVDKDEKTGKAKINDFMAMYVFDHATNKIAIAEFTQVGIRKAIVDLAQDSDWGHPQGFDITINKQGEGFNTKYTIKPSPKKPLDKKSAAIVAEAEGEFDLEKALAIEEA